MGRERQLTVDENTEVASGVRDGDARAEHQDVVAVRDDGRLGVAESLAGLREEWHDVGSWLLWLGEVESGARDVDGAGRPPVDDFDGGGSCSTRGR